MENVTKWLMKVTNSEATRKGYQARINVFAKYMKDNHNIDIETLKDAYREAKYKGEMEREKFLDKLHDAIEDYSCFIKMQKYTNMLVKVIISTISSYIKKGCQIRDVEIDIPQRVFPVFHNRDITKEEIKTILEHATLRDRTFFLMMLESGLRPSTLLGLRYKYIKQDYEQNIVPMKIELPSELLKDRISARFSFIGEDGFKVLKEYLSTRKEIGDNDFLFLPERPSSTKGEVPSECAISNKFNRLVLKLKLDVPIGKRKPKSVRLYNLRKYFFNNMKCDSAYRNYWFCHKSIDDHYISTQEDKHREEYAKGYKFLRVFQATDVDVRLEALTNELKAKDQRIQDLEKRQENIADMEKNIEKLFATLKEQQNKMDIGDKKVDEATMDKQLDEAIDRIYDELTEKLEQKIDKMIAERKAQKQA